MNLFAWVMAALLLAAEPHWSHEISVAIDPNTSHIEVVDRLTVGGETPAAGPSPLRFDLHSGLRIRSFLVDGKESLNRLKRPGAPVESHLTAYEGPPLAPGARVTLKYDGVIHDPVKSEGDLGFVAGDVTTGLIGPEGVFLDGGTGWVPLVRSAGGDLARYKVTSRIPPPWQVVTQSAEIPSDGVALVAGKYKTKSLTHDGVRITTWFFEEEAGLADLYLKSTAEYLDRFSALLTPYPYKRFDIVENFFTTGYGFPSFTLLGQDVVKMGEMALRPGYVDHEVMHCWWGNFVYPDTATGNWSEGLTTYFANYLAQEAVGEEAAAEYRRNIATKYSLRVKPAIDYPLSRFVTKTHDYDNEIGYGKAAMVFHMLRHITGDELFFSVMREMVERYGGRRAGWDDFRRAFEKAAGRDLTGFFEQWIGRTGLPDLALDGVSVVRQETVYKVTGRILQSPAGGAPYSLSVPVIVDTAGGPHVFQVDVADANAGFSLPVDSLPVSIRLDPDMHVPRHLTAAEIPPCLNAVIESDNPQIVVPVAVKSNPEDPYMQIAQRIGDSKGGSVIGDTEAAGQPDQKGRSLLLLGRPDENGVTRRMLGTLVPSVKVTAEGFTVAGETFRGADYSLLVSTRPPGDPEQVVTLYFGMSPAALARARYALFYGWDSWVVFKAGRVEKRGYFQPDDPRSRRSLLEAAAGGAPAVDGAVLMSHVHTLASAEAGGRRAGSAGTEGAGHESAVAYIEARMKSAGLAPPGDVVPFAVGYRHTFPLDQPDLATEAAPAAQLRLRLSSRTVAFDAEPFPFLPPSGSDGELQDTDQVVFIDPEELSGLAANPDVAARLDDGVVFTLERPAAGEADADQLADQIAGAARLGAAALVIIKGSEGPSLHESLISFPSRLSAPDAQAIEARRKKGGFTGVDIFLAAQRGRLSFVGPQPEILVLSVGPEVGVELFGHERFTRMKRPPLEATEPGLRPVLLQMEVGVSASLRRDRKLMTNLLGYLEGADPSLAGEAVLVAAHYDAMGRSEDGAFLPGASDNAAGVAALLEMARMLGEPGRRPRRSILFAFFDAEEWGLAGSHALAGRLAELNCRLTSVMNVDSLGGGDPGTLFLIGGSHQPALRRVAEVAAGQAGLTLGRDIDAYAFDFGSDYYPFHLAGIPAAGFFAADYRSLHTKSDTVEALNADALAAAARAASLTVWAMAN